MTQPTTEPTPNPDPNPTYTPPATQADLDRIIGERISRERAKYGDYAELQRKASEWDKVEEKNRTDLENAQKKAGEQEERAAKAELRALRLEVAAAKELPLSMAPRLIGTTQAELEADADKLKADLPRQGTTSAPSPFTPGGDPGKRSGRDEGKAEAAKRFGAKQ